MAVSGVAVTVSFLVWDTSANAGKTGDAANLTLRLVRDGVEATPSGTPAQLDATNAPGVYTLALTAAENTGTAMGLVGKSSTASVVVVPTMWHNLDASIASRAATGAAMTLTAAYDAAKTAAQAGDEMDLVDAPNATAIAAIQSGIGSVTVTLGGTSVVSGSIQVYVPRGDSYSLVVTVTDSDGDAIDLSSYDVFTFTVKPRSKRSDADDSNAVFQSTGSLSGTSNNVLTFQIGAADTELCALDSPYDCDIEASSTDRSLVRTVALGTYMTTLDVTRGTSP